MHTLSECLARHLERRGWWVRDDEDNFLIFDASDDSTVDNQRGHSITYRIALGPHACRKALTLQTLPRSGEFEHGLALANGFSLHAGVVAAADERAKLVRLCRYITRPAVRCNLFLGVTNDQQEPAGCRMLFAVQHRLVL